MLPNTCTPFGATWPFFTFDNHFAPAFERGLCWPRWRFIICTSDGRFFFTSLACGIRRTGLIVAFFFCFSFLLDRWSHAGGNLSKGKLKFPLSFSALNRHQRGNFKVPIWVGNISASANQKCLFNLDQTNIFATILRI